MRNRQHMTTLALALFCLAAWTGPATALENLGLAVGVERTKLEGDEPADFKFQPEAGYLVGAVVEFSLGSDVLLSFQPGFRHASTGLAYKDQQAGTVRDSLHLQVDWLVLPVLARIGGQGAFFATGGLDLALAVGGGLEGGDEVEPAEDFVGDIDVAALVGVGFELTASRYLITCELRYRQGLVNMANMADPSNEMLPARFRFSGLRLQAGVLLPIGGS